MVNILKVQKMLKQAKKGEKSFQNHHSLFEILSKVENTICHLATIYSKKEFPEEKKKEILRMIKEAESRASAILKFEKKVLSKPKLKGTAAETN